jgi:hypothetical protein
VAIQVDEVAKTENGARDTYDLALASRFACMPFISWDSFRGSQAISCVRACVEPTDMSESMGDRSNGRIDGSESSWITKAFAFSPKAQISKL